MKVIIKSLMRDFYLPKKVLYSEEKYGITIKGSILCKHQRETSTLDAE